MEHNATGCMVVHNHMRKPASEWAYVGESAYLHLKRSTQHASMHQDAKFLRLCLTSCSDICLLNGLLLLKAIYQACFALMHMCEHRSVLACRLGRTIQGCAGLKDKAQTEKAIKASFYLISYWCAHVIARKSRESAHVRICAPTSVSIRHCEPLWL